MTNAGQIISASIAWGIVGILFVTALVLVYEHEDLPWSSALTFICGSILLGLAGALAATHAIENAATALPSSYLTGIIVCRAASAALFLGVVMRLTGRPRWLLRVVDRLF